MGLDDVLRKVRNLLELSEHPATNENEAAAAAGAAQRLMTKHAIDQAMLAQDEEQPEEPTEIWDDPLDVNGSTAWRMRLAVALAKANGCSTYRTRLRGKRCRKIIGKASDVSKVRYLYALLVNEVDRLAKSMRGNGRTWLNNYRHGVVDAIASEIREESDRLFSEMRSEVTGSALVRLDNAIATIRDNAAAAKELGRVKLNLGAGGGYSHAAHGGARSAGRSDGRGVYGSSTGARQVGSGRGRIGK